MIQSLPAAETLMVPVFPSIRMATWWKTLKVQSHIRLAVQSMLQPVLFRAADLFMKKPQSPFWGTAAFFLYYSTSLNGRPRSEEHTSELQSRFDLVCRLLLEKKNLLIR